MKNRHVARANIENLTRLWQQMGVKQQQQGYAHHLNITASWPYRCWAGVEMNRETLQTTMEVMKHLPKHYIAPVWMPDHISIENETKRFAEQGFELAFEQTAMYMDLQQTSPEIDTEIELVRIVSAWDIKKWTHVASRSFGYEIDEAVIARVSQHPEVKLLMAFVDGEPVATVLVFSEENVAGVHQMGVIPEYRGRGIAFKIMEYIIHYCQQMRNRYITLQASSVGEPLYIKIGFKRQFKIYNFQQIC